jgi:glycerol 3-phosphatase-2
MPGSPSTHPSPSDLHGTWVIDLDGVIWLAGEPIGAVGHAVDSLRAAGVRVLFATNNSAPTRAELHQRLANCGITTTDADLLSSADVAAEMLPVGSTALVVADDGVREALAHEGSRSSNPGPPTRSSSDGPGPSRSTPSIRRPAPCAPGRA